jgi:uncharacterized protein YraI
MKIQPRPTTAVVLLLGLVSALIFGANFLPAYAQEGVGDQMRAQTEPLYSSGEGGERVLTSNWRTLAPDQQHVYRFDYTGGEQPIRVWMDSMPAEAVQFQIWTDELVTQLNDDPQLAPLAVGEPISEGSGSSIWRGNAPNPQIYYVTVRTNAQGDVQYLLNIASPGLADTQPGQEQPTPEPPTPEQPPQDQSGPDQPPVEPPTSEPPSEPPAPEPPTATPVPPEQVATPVTGDTSVPAQAELPGVTRVPAAQPDPANVAIVSAPALNVRSGPSTAYPVITTVPAGTALTVIGRNDVNTWIAVRLQNGMEGWVTRTLTNYVGVADVVLTSEAPPAPTLQPGVAVTPTPDTSVVVVEAPSPEALDGSWRVISEGETHWYTFQYRGGGLPVHVWMDMEPDKGAIFNILDRQTALNVLAGVAPNVVNAVGRGTANPVEPGYVFWRADFPEADIYYVMVQHQGVGDVVYSIHVAGPGLSRPVPQQGVTP